MPSTPDDLTSRIRLIRRETYGEDGIADLAKALGLPTQTWRNVEDGVRIPGEFILRFLLLTGAEVHWLLTGEGDKYRSRRDRADLAERVAASG
jgi:hypothetical protein